MTCIIALRQNGKVYLAGDRMGSSTSNKFVCKLPKVFKHGEMLIGFCGSFHLQSILQHRLEVLPIQTTNIDKYIHTKFITELADQVIAMDYRSDQANYRIEGDLLIAANNKIYLLEGFDSVIEIAADYYAAGSGYEYALGALSVLKENKKMSPKVRLKKAMEAVIEHSPSVGLPMDLISDAD